MFKALSFLLISLFTTPIANNVKSGTFARETKQFSYNEPAESAYPYSEGEDGHGYKVRIYKTTELTPTFVKSFKAPSGFNVKLHIDEDQLEAIMNEMDSVDPDYSKAVCPVYYYNLYGSSVFVDLDYLTTYDPGDDGLSRREQIKNGVRDSVNNITLFSVDELINDVDLQLDFRMEVVSQNGDNNVFFFTSETYSFQPYGEYDFVDIKTFYYQSEGGADVRVDVFGEPMEGLIYEKEGDNEDGFHVDDGYEITVMSKGLPLGVDSVQMSFPKNPIEMNIRLRFKSGGTLYTFFSETISVVDPGADVLVDGYPDRDIIQKNTEHTFSLGFENVDIHTIGSASVHLDLYPYHLNDENVVVINDLEAAKPGVEGVIYYHPLGGETISDDISQPVQGEYLMWAYVPWESKYDFTYYSLELLSNGYSSWDDEGNVEDAFSTKASVPATGRWVYNYGTYFGDETGLNSYLIDSIENKFVDVIDSELESDNIVLKVGENALDTNDSLNLVADGEPVVIVPTVETEREEQVTYFFSYQTNKEGVVEITEGENGALTIKPLSHGVVELTISVSCRLYDNISKTITIRVLDTAIDVSKVEVPDEFHYAGKDLTASISVRGFTKIRNLPIEWSVTDKDGKALAEDKIIDNKDATLTIPKAESGDYVITASYEGIELDTLTVQVRYVDMNKFLRTNIWWIFIITLGFVALAIFLSTINKKGKTTVEHIERVYDVFCKCMSDDNLTKEELNKIKKEITKCLHRCEDLNIDALNQYEKATRYLRKSLADTKNLLNSYDTLTPEERGILTERLDKDLAKALNVAKEIEAAKDLIEAYHTKANRQNYEVLKDETNNPKKK